MVHLSQDIKPYLNLFTIILCVMMASEYAMDNPCSQEECDAVMKSLNDPNFQMSVMIHGLLQQYRNPLIVHALKLLVNKGVDLEYCHPLWGTPLEVIERLSKEASSEEVAILKEMKKLVQDAIENKSHESQGEQQAEQERMQAPFSILPDQALWQAVTNSNLEELHLALSEGEGADAARACDGQIIHLALSHYSDADGLEILKTLLEHGADPEVRSMINRLTPLEQIERSHQDGNEDAVLSDEALATLEEMKRLLQDAIKKKRANEDVKCQPIRERLQRPLSQPEESSYLRLLPTELRVYVQQLLANSEAVTEATERDQRIMGQAVYSGDLEQVRMLIQQGVDPETILVATVGQKTGKVSESKAPGLFIAASRDNGYDIVQLLLPFLTDLNPLYEGRRLLDVLRSTPDREEIVALIERGLSERGLGVPIVLTLQGRQVIPGIPVSVQVWDKKS